MKMKNFNKELFFLHCEKSEWENTMNRAVKQDDWKTFDKAVKKVEALEKKIKKMEVM
jgi:hypothetical protein